MEPEEEYDNYSYGDYDDPFDPPFDVNYGDEDDGEDYEPV